MTIKEKLAAFHTKKIDFYTLIREILTHNTWCIASQNDQPLLLKENDQAFLLLFTDYECFVNHNGNSIKHLIKTGAWISKNLSNTISAVIIDPNEDHAIQLPSQYFLAVQKLSKSLDIEEILLGTEPQKSALSQLQSFQHYLVPIIQDSNGVTHITLAPDDQGRKLAAIFTAEDCLQAFVAASKHLLGEDIQVDEISGTQLFQNLSTLEIDGVVFNCNGPTSPRALSIDFVTLLAKDK
jgi:hypothetical protein